MILIIIFVYDKSTFIYYFFFGIKKRKNLTKRI
jgi:hypothetical protein